MIISNRWKCILGVTLAVAISNATTQVGKYQGVTLGAGEQVTYSGEQVTFIKNGIQEQTIYINIYTVYVPLNQPITVSWLSNYPILSYRTFTTLAAAEIGDSSYQTDAVMAKSLTRQIPAYGQGATGCYYYIRTAVETSSNNGVGGYKTGVLLKTVYDISFSNPVLAAPTDVNVADGASTTDVTISWTASSGATSYSVYRYTANSSSLASLQGTTNATTYTDYTATPGVLYYYWVKTSNSTGTSGFSTYDTGYRALATPLNVSASDTSSDMVTVTWSAVTGASYYRVYRATSFGDTKTALGSWQTALSYSDVSATAGTTYYYWVVAAVDSSGSRPGAYSFYDTGITINGVHPADVDENMIIETLELLDYVDGWQRNLLNYQTLYLLNAIELWQSNKPYVYDAAEDPPNCWKIGL